MNARIFKKKCKVAMAMLIATHGMKPEEFFGSETGESWCYSARFVRRFPRHQRFRYLHLGSGNYIRLAKGTPMYESRSYEGEVDVEPAIDVLNTVEFYELMGAAEMEAP